MFVNKFLKNSRALVSRNVLQIKNSGESLRKCHIVAVPARSKVSGGEFAIYAVLLGISMWALPFWIFYHIPDYQKENRNEYTGK